MLKVNGNGSLIVVSGPSGAGKDTICNKVVEEMDNIWISVSMTSRSPRNGEIEGKDYFFITKEEFEKRIEENTFLEFAVVHNNCYYGTPKDKIEEYINNGIDVILVIDIQGALKIKEIVPTALFIFIMPPDMKTLKKRLIGRKTENKEKILERFQTAYNEINNFKKYNYVVVNDEIDKAVDKVKSIIKSEKCRVERIEDIYLDNKEELIHEILIDKEFENEEMRIENEKN